jgi:hypothetical protein
LNTTVTDIQQSWDDVLDRYRGLGPDSAVGVQMIAFVEALRPRWEATIVIDTWMFDLAFSRRDRPKDAIVRVERKRPVGPDQPFVVALLEDRPRLSLEASGGRLEIAGDICSPESAVDVVDSFLMQLGGS